MKDSKEKAYVEEANTKEHLMFPTGFQWQQPPSLPEGVPESKFYHGQSFALVNRTNGGLVKHLPAKLNKCLASLQRIRFLQLPTHKTK